MNMVWKTYLILHFGTIGIPMTEILKKVETIGFKTTLGPVDFIYEWDKKPTKEEISELGNKLVEILKGTGSVFNLDTHD